MTPDNVRVDVASVLGACRAAADAGRGYIYHSDHPVPCTVSWQTYQFVMEMVDRYGKY
jgi:hypothetical protein